MNFRLTEFAAVAIPQAKDLETGKARRHLTKYLLDGLRELNQF